MYAGTCLAVDPADLKPRSNLSIALGCIPHLIILAFAVIVVWTAKPSSSKTYKFTPPNPINITSLYRSLLLASNINDPCCKSPAPKVVVPLVFMYSYVPEY